MKITVTINSQNYEVDRQKPIPIAIPLHFNESQPNPHGVSPAISTPREVPGMIGDTRLKGSVNWEQLILTPHSNGTHTECVGHITDERLAVNSCFSESFIACTVISVTPLRGGESDDSYLPEKDPKDQLITKASLTKALDHCEEEFCEGLVIRTLPNPTDKRHRCYLKNPPAFFSLEAMAYLVKKGVRHLLVDLPSVDRASDGGHLAIHRLFWGVAPGSKTLDQKVRQDKTITEMIFVPDNVPDGQYLLNIQIPCFMSDAAPSRPLLFPLIPSKKA
ncbi:MAG: arylformamidase [Chlamydiales bacterium]